ncbi:MAG TPA: hypothetical protein VLM85_04190 [Polyangiaceae bacterium]|nr:hypothetical protein [Polyangiaceae bacterium]
MKRLGLLGLLALVAGACTTPAGDSPAPYDASVLGPGMRLRDVQDSANGLAGQVVDVTSTVVTAIDNFDETKDGKSRGTVYLQDVDIAGPLAGISLFSPTFVPANLRLAPGDVVDMNGQYVEQQTIGSTVNFAPDFLPQMAKPTVQQRFETNLPDPVVINVADLDNFATGRRWLGMLVQVQDVTVAHGPSADTAGRVTAQFNSFVNGAGISNELYDLPAGSFPDNTHFKSITGLVTFFFNLKIAPRSAADLVQ